jgi:hypothetical protein
LKSNFQLTLKAGPVAQLVSAPPCHGGGRGFKSRLGRDFILIFFDFTSNAVIGKKYSKEVKINLIGLVAQLVRAND